MISYQLAGKKSLQHFLLNTKIFQKLPRTLYSYFEKMMYIKILTYKKYIININENC